MSQTIKLYHISHAYSESIEEIRKNGLSPKYWNTCVGGQKEGFYFFTREMWAKQWVDRCSITDGKSGYMCSTIVQKSAICFPNWRVDLFFNQRIIDKIPSFLKKIYKDKIDSTGYVPLNILSKTATRDTCDGTDWSFLGTNIQIEGLRFKGNNCSVIYKKLDPQTEKPNYLPKTQSVVLSSAMDDDYLGIADTLIEHLCKRDTDFLKYYNKRLQSNISNGFCFGAVKCVESKNMPVSVRSFCLTNEKSYIYLFYIFANLVAIKNDLTNIPVHKRVEQFGRDMISIFRD